MDLQKHPSYNDLGQTNESTNSKNQINSGEKTDDQDSMSNSLNKNLSETFEDQKKLLQNGQKSNPSDPPNFPNSLYTMLPDFIKRVIVHADSDDERDILLLGGLVSTGACLTNVYGFYHDMKVHPNLFLFITASASGGKGRLSLCKKLVKPIHQRFRELTAKEKEKYENALEYNKKNKKEAQEIPNYPKEQMLFIPANSSSTGVYQILEENNSKGLIFETEGDVLSNAFRSEHGNYSAGFRQAFHHETISYHRRTNNEYKEIENPKLSAVLSGTPVQIQTLIPNTENGLFSRFMFYKLNLKTDWIDVFSNKASLNTHFENLGTEFLEIYKSIRKINEIEFSFTKVQQKKFHEFFSQNSKKHTALQGLEFISIYRRSGIIFFRLAMILSIFRAIEKNKGLDTIVCEDIDFNNTIQMIETLLQHSQFVFSQVPKATKPRSIKTLNQKYLELLPHRFNRIQYLKIAEKLNLNKKAADKLVSKLKESNWLQKEKHNCYINLSKENSNNN